jgi:signal transduction histidine kinase/ligand-binding sensor domain-containing protein
LFGSALGTSVRISQYGHTAWRMQDGVLKAGVTKIAQTTDGYLWVGTRGGLLRFDGVRFVPWEDIASAKVRVGDVYCLASSRDGSLWICLFEKIVRWKGGVATTYDLPGHPDTIVESQNGDMWIGISRVEPKNPKAVCRWNRDGLQCYGQADGIPVRSASPIALAGADQIWIASRTGLGLWDVRSHSFTPIKLRARDPSSVAFRVSDLVADPDGTVWAGFDSAGGGLGLQSFQAGARRPLLVPGFNSEQLHVAALFRDPQGTIWVGTLDDGIYRIAHGQVDHYRSTEGLSADLVRAFLLDREGNLWVGTSKGLDRFRELPVVSYTKTEGLSSEDAASIAVSPDGTVSIGNLQKLDQILPGATPHVTTLRSIPPGQVENLLYDRRGRLWAALGDHLYVLDHGQSKLIRSPSGEEPGFTKQIIEDDAGDIWAHAVLHHDEQARLMRIHNDVPADAIPIKETFGGTVQVVAKGPRGDFWLALRDGSLSHWKDGQFTPFAKDKPFKPGITRMIVTTDDIVLLSNSAGLTAFTPSRQQLLDRRAGLPCREIYEVRQSHDGDLWLYCDSGLVRVTGEQFQAWWKGSERQISPRVFDRFDGAFPAFPTFFPASSQGPDGRLWFVNDDIVQMVDPQHLPLNKLPPPVHIESLSLDGKPHAVEERVNVPAGTRSIQFDYTALSLAVPQKVRFRYKLEGWDGDWQNGGDSREASYTNLPPRKYLFRVTACNNDGVWNEMGAKLAFSIDPAFYQTVWFRLLCVAAAVGILLIAIRWRMLSMAARLATQFQQRLEERTRIAQDLHDTLLQGFISASLQLSVANRELTADSKAKPIIGEVLELMGTVIEEGRTAVGGMRLTQADSSDLEKSFSRIRAEAIADQPANFRVQVEGPERPLHALVRDDVYRIGREAIINAFRHSGAANVEVELRYSDRDLRLFVRDDGCGIEPQVLRDGRDGHWGLSGMRETAERIGAKLRLQSRPGEGTEVELTVPAEIAFAASPGPPAPRWWRAFRSRSRSKE